MATEHDVLLRKVASDGAGEFYYPVTYARNILDLQDYGMSVVTSTMLASGWVDGSYSFEETYPTSQYDLIVELDYDRCADEHIEAWNDAAMVGSASANVCRSLDFYPEIDIPIIIKVVKKI